MNRLRMILLCNSVVWLLAVVYCFVPYTANSMYDGKQTKLYCQNAFSENKVNQYAYLRCTPSGRLAEIVFWALLASAVVTALILVGEKKWKVSDL